MDLRQSAGDDEISVDDLLAGVRTTAEVNATIREGLAKAGRGGTVDLGIFAGYRDEPGSGA